MSKILYTTHNDLSLPLFSDWDIRFYGDNNAFQAASPTAPTSVSSDTSRTPSSEALSVSTSDLIYFRDPFNDPNYRPNPMEINGLMQSHSAAQIIDKVHSFEQIYDLEDKYLQSQQYSDFSPKTWLPSEIQFQAGRHLAKPRISQRAKDILFNIDGRQLDDGWIIQELLDIKEELRVYAVHGQILPVASIKSSKVNGSVKIIGQRPLASSEQAYITEVVKVCPLDFVGFDLAILDKNNFMLIEANRSPQFLRYAERTGENLAELL